MNEDEIRQAVREAYARIASAGGRPQFGPAGDSCCGPQDQAAGASCCGPAQAEAASCCGTTATDMASLSAGYSEGQLGSIPDAANLGLGCGNPTALASLKPGEVVLDLGSGGGIDCFLASDAVGEEGRVIGVDMTPEMLARARENARRGGYANVEFRLGEIENLPVADGSVDVIISNCVINLSPDKPRVFREAYRALRPGGRVMVSDIVLNRQLPEHVMSSIEAYAGCVAGASMKRDYLAAITEAGFGEVEVVGDISMGSGELEGAISSVNVRATRTG